MSRILALASIALQTVIGNNCETKATLTAAGAAATIGFVGPISYTIGGVYAPTKATNATQSFVPTHDWQGKAIGPAGPGYAKYDQPVGTTAYYVVALNAAGTVAIVQGSYAGQIMANAGDLSKRERGTGDIPVEPDGYTAIGYIKVVNGSTAVYVPGVTLFNVAGIAATCYDCKTLPAVAA